MSASHTRNTKRADIRQFQKIAEKCGIPASRLAEQIGYGVTAYSGWVSGGTCPLVAINAAEAVALRNGGDRHEVLVIVRTVGGIPSSTFVAENPGRLSINDEEFILIPVKQGKPV